MRELDACDRSLEKAARRAGIYRSSKGQRDQAKADVKKVETELRAGLATLKRKHAELSATEQCVRRRSESYEETSRGNARRTTPLEKDSSDRARNGPVLAALKVEVERL